MLAHYQPQQILLQTIPGAAVSTVPAVPVVVEVQRMNDNAFFMYNVNVQTPEITSTTAQAAQSATTVTLQAVPAASVQPAICAPPTMLASPPSVTQQLVRPTQTQNRESSNSVIQNQDFFLHKPSIEIGPTTSGKVNVSWPTKVCSYPQELTTLFRWNVCGLCHTHMRSVRNAVDHYASRAHDRKINAWLMRNLNNKDQLPHEMMHYVKPNGPDAFYCELCDLKLTSIVHANQHFFGRRHRMVARHVSKPNGPGFYDALGKWVRTNVKCLMCPICEVSITSESQMAMHLAGSKHQRKLDVYNSHGMGIDGSYVYSFNADGSLHPLNPDGQYFFQCSQQNNNVGKYVDLNAMYFCEVCEVSLNHLKSVKQHEDGKMHRKKVGRLRYCQNYAVSL